MRSPAQNSNMTLTLPRQTIFLYCALGLAGETT